MINRCSRKHLKKSAFTLIELLVVIAIISILAAILFPSFSRARENARKTSCANNMRQLAIGFAQYINDFDGRYPGAAQYQKWSLGGHWVAGPPGNLPMRTATGQLTQVVPEPQNGAIYPYVKNVQVYICPSVEEGEYAGLTYTMNCAIAGAKENSVRETSSVILLDDEKVNNDGFFYAVNSPNSTDQMTSIHNGGGNLAFMDGHVKYYPFAVFPVNSANGALKTRTDKAPRFYDLGFGTQGFYNPTTPTFGTCQNP